MKIKLFLVSLLLVVSQAASIEKSPCVLETKKIHLRGFPKAFNPSILKVDKGYLMTFRQNLKTKKGASEVGIVLLNDQFEPITKPQLLNTRFEEDKAPPQAQDARLIEAGGKIYILYNDNVDKVVYIKERRDMFLAELTPGDNGYVVEKPTKLVYPERLKKQRWEKNWVPFAWKDTLLLGYSLMPHLILTPEDQGVCRLFNQSITRVLWKWGTLSGGTPAQLVDGNYLAFFHSSIYSQSKLSKYREMKHYYMGAYTFSPEPPFNVLAMSPTPLMHPDFYKSGKHIRAIFPGGYVVEDSKIHMVYGKNDCEMWVVTLDKEMLLNSLQALK